MSFEINLSVWFKCGIKAIIWFFWNVVFGLMPFMLVAFIASFRIDSNYIKVSQEEFHHLLNDCVVLFFCTAIMAEITIESFLCKVKFSKYFYLGVCSTLFPVLIIVILIYYGLIIGNSKVFILIDLSNFIKFHKFIIIFSAVFCIFIRTALFWEEDKMNAICQSMVKL